MKPCVRKYLSLRAFRHPGGYLLVGAVDRPAAANDPAVDLARDEVWGVPRQLEGDAGVVEVLPGDGQLDDTTDLAAGLPLSQVGERLRPVPEHHLPAVGLVRRIQLELAGRRERRLGEEVVDGLLGL